jgi:hypothetical protein
VLWILNSWLSSASASYVHSLIAQTKLYAYLGGLILLYESLALLEFILFLRLSRFYYLCLVSSEYMMDAVVLFKF